MADFLKKRGQKIVKKFSKASIKASEEGKEHIKEMAALKAVFDPRYMLGRGNLFAPEEGEVK